MRNLILRKNGLSGWMELALRAVVIAGIPLTVSLPFTLNWILSIFGLRVVNMRFYWVLMGFMAVFSVLMLAFIYCATRIFHSINTCNPFINGNVKNLSAMSVLSLLIALDCWVYALIGNSVLAIVLGLVFVFLWGLFLVLRELFRAAVQFKNENDFTI